MKDYIEKFVGYVSENGCDLKTMPFKFLFMFMLIMSLF